MSEPVVSSAPRSATALVALLLSVFALVATGFLGQQVFQQRWEAKHLQESQQDSMATLTERLERTMRAHADDQKASEATLAQLQAQWGNLQEQLARMTEFTQDDWLIAEGAYLAYIAQVHLNTRGDTETAIKQLKMAEARLQGVLDPSALPLKEALTHHRAQLEQAGRVEWESLWLRLGEVIEALPNLPLDLPDQAAKPLIEPTEKGSPLDTAWSEIKSLVRIRHVPEHVMPLVTLQEQAQFVHGLQLLLEEARWAVLQRQPDIYQKVLALTEKRLGTYFVQTDPKVQAIQSEIAALKAESLTTDSVDLSELNRLFAQRTQ